MEDYIVNSRKWVFLFLSTLGVGGISTIITSMILEWDRYVETGLISEFLAVLVWFAVVGFTFSVLSQMGYFAYLTVHRFGLGLFGSAALWNGVQVLIIAIVLFDLIYFRHQWFSEEASSILPILIIPFFLYSLLIAYIKRKETNRQAFIPAVFFMFVVTSIEIFPALKASSSTWLYLMLIPLLLCNTWQLLILHKLTKTKKS